MEGQHGNIPIRSGKGTTGVSVGEHKDAGGVHTDEMLHTAQLKGQELYNKALDVKHNWRNYPKALTAVVLLSCMLLGAGMMAGVQSLSGGRRNYLSSHWDRTTADAHHALDVILDHVHHPELYAHKQGAGMVTKARHTVMDMLEGILPGRSKSSRMYGRGGMGMGMGGDHGLLERTGEQVRDLGSRAYEKMSDLASDTAYGMRRGGERAYDTTKDTGYGIGHKISDLASSVKNTFTGGSRVSDYADDVKDRMRRGYDKSGSSGSWLGLGGGRNKMTEDSGSSWLGGGRKRGAYSEGERDELDMATKQMRGVLRDAERDL